MLKEIHLSLSLVLVFACGLLYQLTLRSHCFFACLPLFTSPQGPEGLLRSGRSIVFIETSERVEPSPLVTCAVESAANIYPEQPIIFFMKWLSNATRLTPNTSSPAFSLLSAMDNVFFVPLDMRKLFADTPLFSWYTKVNSSAEKHWLHVSSDASRLAIIWKYGGIYMDTDVISIRPIPEENFLAAEGSRHSSNGRFYPIPYLHWRRYYEVWDSEPNFNDSYALHLWNFMNKEGRTVVRGSNTLVENLYRKHCPKTYKALIQDVNGTVSREPGSQTGASWMYMTVEHHPLNHGQPTTGHTAEESWLSLSQHSPTDSSSSDKAGTS
ncbi:alpha-1,4-N-acetylglucosaminyltransferase isoform X4 [Mesocricetus auratus]|uniref:Alpha-1,4-N-acetylglucosaminyltransferase isoform X4 n=1 Tax=Mesocricetus auratus TaxID=10036 RepID=A0ABM2WZN0_MESAU|nr:alpha-1,4-N-acetylglucosaminyltransferase isoform X4 [Mesocricetus auratus]